MEMLVILKRTAIGALFGVALILAVQQSLVEHGEKPLDVQAQVGGGSSASSSSSSAGGGSSASSSSSSSSSTGNCPAIYPVEVLVSRGTLSVGDHITTCIDAAVDDVFYVSTCGSDFDTELGGYDSSCNLIKENDDSCGLQSIMTGATSVSPGEQLSIVLGGYNTDYPVSGGSPPLCGATGGGNGGSYTL